MVSLQQQQPHPTSSRDAAMVSILQEQQKHPTNTECVHGGVVIDAATGAVLTPIFQTTTFQQPSVEQYLSKGYCYSRSGNPTVSALEAKIGILEGTSSSSHSACAFTTGMAATCALFAACLKQGDHVVITECSYGGTNRAARVLYERQYGIEFSFVDFTDLAAIREAIIPGRTKMLLSESPCNPTLQLQDIQAISDICKEFNGTWEAEPFEEVLADGDGPTRRPLHGRILHVTDSTLATPMVNRPLEHGADITLISLTKYYDGHNISLGGAVVCKERGVQDIIRFYQNVHGSIISPQVAFYMLQTSKTLGLRIKQQSESAMKIAEYLACHEKVDSVNYPGLASHPQSDIAQKQHTRGCHGGMLSFEVKGGTFASRALMNNIPKPWTLAENLGATESIITCPAVFTHANMSKAAREKVGISDGLIRVSVGIENVEDLIAGLEKALSHVQ